MAQLFFNNGRARLAAAISASQTTLQLQGRVNLPDNLAAGDWFLLTVARQDSRYGSNVEVVKVTGVSGDTVTVQREYEGTAVPHDITEVVECRTTADTYARMLQEALWEYIGNKPATATRWPTWGEVTGKPSTFVPSAHTHPWAEITGAPAQATRWPSWAEVEGKPTNFPPATHSHDWSQVANAPATATRWPSWSEVTDKPATTDSRTSTSTTILLQAKGMNDHRNSGDHDARYHTKTEADGRFLGLASGGEVAGDITIKKTTTSAATAALHGRQTTTGVVSRVTMANDAETSTPGVLEAWRRVAGSLDLELSGFRQLLLNTGLVTTVGVTLRNPEYNPLDVFSDRVEGMLGGIRFFSAGEKKGELNFFSTGAIHPNFGAYFSGNGQGLTNLPAHAIASGIIPTTRLPTTDSRTSSSQTAILTAKAMNDHRVSSDHDSRYLQPNQSGALLTDLNASSLTSGVVPNACISGSYTGMANLTGSGTVDFAKFAGNASDTVTAPSFTWTGDTNTGLYRPAADTIGVSVAGVERARFSSAGISGVGTGLTSLNASNLTTGTVPIARISSTSSRTSTSEATLLHAKAMNDHRLSSDHDSRYVLQSGYNAFNPAGSYTSLRAQGTTKADVGLSNVPNLVATDQDTSSTLMTRNSSGDTWARLFRSSYTSLNSTVAVIYTSAKSDGTDYIRPSSPAQVKAALDITKADVGLSNVANSAQVTTSGNQSISGVKTFSGSININGTSVSPDLQISRTNATTNANMRFTTTSTTDVRIGQGDSGWFSVGAGDDITWAGTGVFRVGATSGNTQWAGTATGNGSGITSLNASNLASGTVPIARISSTSSRTSSSTSSLLQAKAMNDHRVSGDHDGRYIINGETSPSYLGDLRSISGDSDPQTSTTSNLTSYRLKDSGQLYCAAPYTMVALNRTTTTGGNAIDFNVRGAYVGGIYVTSSSVSYNTGSDYRLKEDVAPLANGLARLKALSVYEYLWKNNPTKNKSMGVLAHEAQLVVPEAVSGIKDETQKVGVITLNDEVYARDVPAIQLSPELVKQGATWKETSEKPVYQGVDYSKLVPLLIASVQELSEQVDALKQQLSEVA